jgi:hypothetical protein
MLNQMLVAGQACLIRACYLLTRVCDAHLRLYVPVNSHCLLDFKRQLRKQIAQLIMLLQQRQHLWLQAVGLIELSS